MATYTLTPAERRARAQAIVAQRKAAAQYKESLKHNVVKPQEPQKEEKEDANWFIRTVSTIGDLASNVITGAIKGLEGIWDLGAGVVGAVGGIFSDDFQDSVKKHIAYDFTGEHIGDPLQELFEHSYTKNGGIVESIASGLGQMLPAVAVTVATGGTSAAATVGQAASAAAKAGRFASLATMGVSAAGNSTEEAFNDGANYYAGLGYGMTSGMIEAATEKMTAGASKVLYGPKKAAKEIAETGIKRIAKDAIGEGVEEMASELANPLAKSIYKGKDALNEYKDAEYWSGVGKAGIVGAATDVAFYNTVGRAMAKKGRGHVGKDADVYESLSAIAGQRQKRAEMFSNDLLTDANNSRINENIKGNYQNVEKVLKSASAEKRAKLIEKFNLQSDFEADGTMKAELVTKLDNHTTQQYVSPDLMGQMARVDQAATAITENLRRSYMQDNGATYEQAVQTVRDVTVFQGELTTQKSKSAFSKFKKGLNYLNSLSGKPVNMVVVDAQEDFNASLYDGTIYIGADRFENGDWAGDLVHEYTHFAEGTKEYKELVQLLLSDNVLTKDAKGKTVSLREKAEGSVFDKDYGFTEKEIATVQEKKERGEKLTAKEREQYELFQAELEAHASEHLLGTEQFIDCLVSRNASLARKVVQKIKNLKKMFEREGVITEKEKEQLRLLKKAERLYLAAAEKAGNFDLKQFIHSDEEELEEKIDSDAKVVYNKDGRSREVHGGESEGDRSGDSRIGARDNGGEKFALKDSEPTYTEKQYNSFGWASEAGGITSTELDDLYSKIQARTTLHMFNQSSKGEAIIEVNKKPNTTLDVDNVFVFVKGTKDNFRITRTVRFNVDTEMEMEILKEKLYERGTCSDTYLALYQKEGLTREYRREDSPTFAAYREGRGNRETSRRTNQDNRGQTEHRSGHTHETARIGGSGSEFLKVVHTFTDITGRKRNVIKVSGSEYMIEGDSRSKYQPSIETAVAAENDRIISRYANNSNRTRSWVKNKLKTDPDFLVNERKRGIRFNLVDNPTAKPYFHELTDGQVKKLLLNDDGTPKVVYFASDDGTLREDTDFFEDYEDAKQSGAQVEEVYLSIQKPYRKGAGSNVVVESLKRRGYDGVYDPTKRAYNVFDITQVKSATENAGTFDRQNSDIRFSRKPKSRTTADPETKKYQSKLSSGEARKAIAQYTKQKVYLKKEASKVVSDVIEACVSTEEVEGKILSRDKEEAVQMLWQGLNGTEQMGHDVVARDVAEYILRHTALDDGTPLGEVLEGDAREEYVQLLQESILHFSADVGKDSKRAKQQEKWKKQKAELKERIYEAKKRNSYINRLLHSIQKIEDHSVDRFQNASQHHGHEFKGTIEKLKRIKHRGDFNESGTREIVKQMTAWYNEDNLLLKGSYDENIVKKIENIQNGDGALTASEVKDLLDIVDHCLHVLKHFDKVWRNGKLVSVVEIAKRYVLIQELNEKYHAGWPGRLYRRYVSLFGDPMTVVRLMDQYQDGFFTEMLEEHRQGAISAQIDEMEIRAAIDGFLQSHKNYLKNLEKRTVKYLGQDIPAREALALYMTLERTHALPGLAENGFVYTDRKDPNRPEREIAGFAKGEQLTEEALRERAKELRAELNRQFTDADREYTDIIRKTLNETCKEKKAATDEMLHGYTSVADGIYFPIRRDAIAEKMDDVDLFCKEVNAETNAPFNKSTVAGTKNRLYIAPIDLLVDRHIQGIALYANLAIPLSNYQKIYHFDISGKPQAPVSVLTRSRNVWKDGEAYFKELRNDMLGFARSKHDMVAVVRKNYAKFQLGFNPKVWLTQLASFASAYNLLDVDCIVKGMGLKTNDVDEYCKFAKLRNSNNTAAMAQGILEPNTKAGKAISKANKIGDLMMKPIGMVDRIVIKQLFGACQMQIQKNGGPKVGTQENKVKAGELLQKVILETQQNSVATERSRAMRSDSEFYKMLTMFSADSMKSIGRVLDALGELHFLRMRRKAEMDANAIAQINQRIKAAKKKAARSVTSLASSAILMALIAQLFRTLYAKDEEDENVIENMAVDAFGNLLGGLPMIRDVYSYMMNGYELENFTYSAINDLLQSGKSFMDATGSIATGEGDSQEIAKATKSVVFAAGQVLGLPTRNVYNMVYGLTKRISPTTAYKIDGTFYHQNYRSDLKKALEEDDEAMVATVLELMLDENVGGIEDTASRKELDRLVRAGYSVIPRSVGDKITYEGEQYELTKKQQKAFMSVYSIANDALASLVKTSQYAKADDEVKAKTIRFIYDVYYNLALGQHLGVDLEDKNLLFAEAIDIEKLALIVCMARSIVADVDGKGKPVSGSKKKKIQAFINSLHLTAAQKYMVMGYLGYSNVNGVEQVKSYVNGLNLSSTEKKRLLEYSGYSDSKAA